MRLCPNVIMGELTTARKRAHLLVLLVLLTAGCAREESAWRTARNTGTVEAFQEFLKHYPEGAFAREAQKAMAILSWDQTKTRNTQQDYEAFLKRFPDSRFAVEAQRAIVTLSWDDANAMNTQQGYQTFLKRFPDSAVKDEAIARSQDFSVRVVGTGEITLSGTQDRLRRGPIFEINPQWATRVARVNDSSSYATDEKGNKVSMLYLIPVNLAGHKARTERLGDGKAGTVTWIPPVNTFHGGYAYGTADQKIGFVFEFSEAKGPVRFGLVYDTDYDRIFRVHILDQVITLPR
jgi:hypothetical protein